MLGIASLAHKCGLEYAPSVFVRVAPFVFDFLPTHDIILSNTTDAVMLPQDKLAGPFRPKKSRVVPSPIPSPPPPTPSPPVVGMDDEDSPMQDEDGDPLPFPSPSDFDDDPFQENGGSNIISLPWLLVSAAVVVVTIVWCIRRG